MSAPRTAVDTPRPPADRLARIWATPPGPFGFLTTTNHRDVGKRYVVTSFLFFLVGGVLALAMRTQLAGPDLEVMSPERFNQFFTMHGVLMMFLFAVPFFEGLGIYLVPLMIGTRDMAFPRLNAFGYFVYAIAGVSLLGALAAGFAPNAGWFNYPPLSGPAFSPGPQIDWWVVAITLLEVAALVAAVELIVTVFRQRAPGMALPRIPVFVWTQVVTAFMVLFAMPPLILTSLFLGLDRFLGMHFFNHAAGGSILLWQHLFWWFGHPEVYIILLPALGVISALVPTFARRPLAGYTVVVASTVAIGVLSFGLWVHHMFAVGLPLLGLNFFAAASMMITIPSGVQIFAWIVTLWKGRLLIRTPLLFAVGFVVLFILGGITGVMVASVPFDWQVHDTYFVVAHFHYVLIGGAVFPVFAAFYYWFPKVTGRMLDERLGKWNFWTMFVGFNVTFFPMHIAGFEGMPRRVYTFAPGLGLDALNLVSTLGSYLLGLGVLIFLVNVWRALRGGERAPADPWAGGTLEWATESPPAPYNFRSIPFVRGREPLWEQEDLAPVDPAHHPWLDELAEPRPAAAREAVSTTTLDASPDSLVILASPSILPFWLAVATSFAFMGVMIHPVMLPLGMAAGAVPLLLWAWPRGRGSEAVLARRAEDAGPETLSLPYLVPGPRSSLWWGVVLLIVIEGTVFAALIASYFYLHMDGAPWPSGELPSPELLLPSIGMACLLASALPVALAERALARGARLAPAAGVGGGLVLLAAYLVLKVVEYSDKPYSWTSHAYGSMDWTMTGYQVLHALVLLALAGAVWILTLRRHFDARRRVGFQVTALYWYFVAVGSLLLFVVQYLSPRLL